MADANFFSSEGGAKKVNSISKPSKSKTKSRKVFKIGGVFLGILLAVFVVVGVIGYFTVFKPAYALVTNINQLQDDTQKIKDYATQRDLVALKTQLDETQQHLNDLRVARDQNVGWMQNFSLTAPYYADSDHFIDAGLHVIDAGNEAIILLEPFADVGGFKVSESAEQINEEVVGSGLADAFAAWISIMPAIAQDIDVVLDKLTLAGEELSQVDASRYPEEFRGQPIRSVIQGAQTGLLTLNDAGPDIKLALTIIPELMGVDTGEQRYMILMENDKEIRPTGGFWTYVSTFKLNNGLLSSDFSSNGTYNVDFTLDAIDAYYTFPTVPDAYNRHLKVERMWARDANVSPDLPSAVDQFMLFWDLAVPLNPEFKPVSGVMTINTQVLEELLDVTGPVTLNGVEYNSESVTLELEKIASLQLAEQANRKKILGDLMEAMLVNVFESDKNLWPKLVEKGIDLANRKHIKGYMFNEDAQALLEKYNYAGEIEPYTEGDYAYAVSTNLGGGKQNTWFVNKTVDHTLTKENDRYVRTTSLNFTHQPKGGEYDVFVQPYQDWVRLYVPAGSELISVEGSDDITGEGIELDKTYFHGFIRLQPGESKTLTFKYYIPNELVNDNEYKLLIQKQSGINSEVHTVTANGKTETIDLFNDKLVVIK